MAVSEIKEGTMTRATVGLFLAGGLLLLPVGGGADDRWEAGSFTTDDGSTTNNELVHGSVQKGHDLQGAPDQDWMVFRAKARHSYEARVSSGTTIWTFPACGSCATFDRVDSTGIVLTPGLADGAANSFQPSTLTVRWISFGGGDEFLRAVGQNNFTALDTYDVELYDTTYLLPRFNNSATQVTFLLVQNATDAVVTGNVDFYNGSGLLLGSQPMTLPAQGLMVLNTATVGGVAGQGGSAAIAHTGGWGALSGKAVALEPGTGFTFDTELRPVPR
jgi:hypothetical protein